MLLEVGLEVGLEVARLRSSECCLVVLLEVFLIAVGWSV